MVPEPSGRGSVSPGRRVDVGRDKSGVLDHPRSEGVTAMSHDDDERPVQNGEVRAAALQHVRAAHRAAETAAQNRIELLRAARSFGATWEQLGEAMDMSRQTAHKRFGGF